MATADLVFNIFARDHASKAFKEIGRAASNLGKSFDKLQTAGKFAAIGGSAVTAIPQVLALTNALVSVAPAAYAIVPAALAGGVALGTLKLATHGVADALGNLGSDSKSVKNFDAAIKSMAPNARSFAVEMKRLYPALVAVQRVVQNTAFHSLASQLKPLARNLLPTIRAGLVGVAQAGNGAALKLAAFFRSAQAKSLLGKALTGVVSAFKRMENLPAKLAKGLLQIAVAAMPAFQRLTGAMVGFFDRFAAYVDNKSAGGKFTAMINGAVDTLGQLGRVAGNIGSALGGIFKAAGTGNTLLDSIEKITAAIANAVNSKKGQEVLQKVFDMMSKAGPVIAIGGAIAFVVGSIGSALVALAEPAVAIAAVLAAVGAGFAYLYTKSSGLREIIGIVGGKLRELWDLFAAKGLPIIRDFAQKALATAIAGFNMVRDAIQRNKPELEQLWRGVKNVATFIMSTWPAMSSIAIGAMRVIFTGVTTVINIIGGAVRSFNVMRGAVTTAVSVATGAFSAFRTKAGEAVSGVINVMKGLPGRIRSALGDLGSLLLNAGRSLIAGLVSGVQSKISDLRDTLSGITNLIPSWKGPLPVDRRLLEPTGQAIMGGLMAGIGSQVTPLQRQLARITTEIPGSPPTNVGRIDRPAVGGQILPRVPGPSEPATPRSGTTHVYLHLTGDDPDLLKRVRKMVRIEGNGNVQVAFGKGS